MKVITVTGSPHKDGNTNQVIAEIARGARDAGHEVLSYDVNDLNPVTCQGCMGCRKTNGDCVINDGLKPYFAELHQAGALVVGGPIYAGGFGGNLISYMNRHYSMLDSEWKVRLRPGIQLVGVVAQGNSNTDEYKDQVKWFLDDFRRRDMELVDVFYSIRSPDASLLERAYKTGRELKDKRGVRA